jgi:hypothetical protein
MPVLTMGADEPRVLPHAHLVVCWPQKSIHRFTSSPGTNSPIQRTFTNMDSFTICQVDAAAPVFARWARSFDTLHPQSAHPSWRCVQEVALQDPDEARVNNVVDFGKWGNLRVSGLKR